MRIVFALMLTLLAAPAMAQQTTAPQVLEAAVTKVIRPAMTSFDSKTSGLQSAMGALCAAPSDATLDVARRQFAQSAEAYGRIEFLRIGPLMDDNRADRLLFWPDRRGIGLRQVQEILATEDRSAIAVDTLRAKSVATQGFGALEFVLYGTDAELLVGHDGAFRCRYGQAVATNISDIASELSTAWFRPDGIADHLIDPQPDNVDYRSDTEAMEALVGQVSHGIESVRDTRINPFIAQGDNAAKPKQALFWRSDLTLKMIDANVSGMEELVAVSGMARAVGEDMIGIDNSIAFEFRNAHRAINLVTLPVEQAVADAKQAQALAYLVLVTQSLQTQMGERLPAALGLSVGFSSLDGD